MAGRVLVSGACGAARGVGGLDRRVCGGGAHVVYSRPALQHGPPSVASQSVGRMTIWKASTMSSVVHSQLPTLRMASHEAVSSQLNPGRG